jgi:hypothetical protein
MIPPFNGLGEAARFFEGHRSLNGPLSPAKPGAGFVRSELQDFSMRRLMNYRE